MSLGSLRRRRSWLVAFALLAFAVRALIPAGYMPSGAGMFALQICPEGLSAQALALMDPHAAHHHHAHGVDSGDDGSPASGHDHHSWASGHCSFGALAGALQSCESVPVALSFEGGAATAAPRLVHVRADHRYRIAQPRGPPSLV